MQHGAKTDFGCPWYPGLRRADIVGLRCRSVSDTVLPPMDYNIGQLDHLNDVDSHRGGLQPGHGIRTVKRRTGEIYGVHRRQNP